MKTLSVQEIIDIYNSKKLGDKPQTIAYKYGLDATKVSNTLQQLKSAMKKVALGTQVSHNSTYQKAAKKLINRQHEQPKPVSQEQATQFDRYNRLQEAFESLQKAVVEFTVAEVKERSAKVLQENEDLKKSLEDARGGNLISTLKKQLEGN